MTTFIDKLNLTESEYEIFEELKNELYNLYLI